MEPSLAIQLYAELLLNIKSLSLSGTIRSKATQETKAILTTDGSEIRVEHEGNVATIRVPAKTIGTAKATLDVPAKCTEPISARLQIDGDLSDLITLRDDNSGNITPWHAPSLRSDTAIRCLQCEQALVKPNAVRAWKDLPSENWAEMMDFWHCHKPSTPQSNGHNDAPDKGYAASNRLVAVLGTGLVDSSTFLLAPPDCVAISVESERKSPNRPSPLQCPSCHGVCGAEDVLASGWRLFKWRTGVQAVPSLPPKSFILENWLASQLLTASEAHGVRRFLVKPQQESANGTLIWLFTPDLYFCSSNSGSETVSDATRGMKILRKPVQPSEIADLENSSSVEDLDLPDDLNRAFLETLAQNTNLLPDAVRKYQGWECSLLRRFSPEDICKPEGKQVLPVRNIQHPVDDHSQL